MVYVGLGLWADKKPFMAILVGAMVYCGILASTAVLDPESLLKGIFIKVIIIAAFIKGNLAVKEVREIQETIDEINNQRKN